MEPAGKSCYTPSDLYQILIQSGLSYKGQHEVEQRLTVNCTENGLEFHGQTPGNGDCFFEAIASQLKRIGAHQFSSEQLRQEVTEYIRQHPTYEGPEGTVSLENFIETTLEDFCDKMAKKGAWADHVIVINMAKMLQRDIMIVTSSPSTSGNDCLVWVSGDTTGKNEPLLLGHMWENHYQSLQPIKLTVSTVIAEKDDTHSNDSTFTKNKDCDGHSEDWLRDKVGLFDILEDVPDFYTPWSLRLFSVMDDIGASEDVRKVRVESYVTAEILSTVRWQPEVSVYNFGSRADATTTLGLKSDFDRVYIFNNLPVVSDPSEHPVGTSLLYIQDSTTPAGYCKLQLVQDGVPQTGDTPDDDPYPDRECRRWLTFTSDTDNRLVCCFAPPDEMREYDERHGPAMTVKGSNTKVPEDNVYAVECINTSRFIYNWLNRTRKFDWPTGDTLQTCETLGCLFVPVGHPHSKFHEQQWRISFSHQEKLLVTQFNPVQFKCYILIKIIKKEIIHEEVPESLSSYHIKTCMFVIIENTPCGLWEPENLLVCISLCLRKLLEWVDAGYCPNYFIPEENMFDRRIHGTVRQRLQAVLQKLISADYKFLSDIQCAGLGKSLQNFLTPHVRPGDVDHSDYISTLLKMGSVRSVCHKTFDISRKHLLCICDSDIETTLNQIMKLVSVLRNSTRITRHTIEETQKAKSFLLPNFELSLMSNSVAYAVDQNKHARDIWRFLTSKRWNEICLSSDSFSSKLKQASMLYMLGYYQTSLNVLSSLTSLVRYSFCWCYIDQGNVVQPNKAISLETTRGVSEITPEHLLRNFIIPCVYFLPTEKSVTPAALCYEMERMKRPRPESDDGLCEHDECYGEWAFVDGNFLLHFLLYLNHSKLNRKQQVHTDINSMHRLVAGNNAKRLSHRETCLNLLGWVFKERGNTWRARQCFSISLKIKPYCNAASLHVLDLPERRRLKCCAIS